MGQRIRRNRKRKYVSSTAILRVDRNFSISDWNVFFAQSVIHIPSFSCTAPKQRYIVKSQNAEKAKNLTEHYSKNTDHVLVEARGKLRNK